MTAATTTTEPTDLRSRIESFQIDEGTPALTFEARLARENGWSLDYARRVVTEYKRFVYLAIAAGHPVTPSDQVDQAWHLHLTYSRSYWDRLCRETLNRPLHHGPTRGGEEEDDKFNDWYERTKASYQRLFNQPPPEDIWPQASIRFGDDLHYTRINTARNWVVSKSLVRRRARLACAAAGTVLLAGCGPLVLGAGADIAVIVVIAVVLLVALIAVAAKSRNKGGARDGSGCGGGCGFFWGGSGCGTRNEANGHHDDPGGCGADSGGSGCGSSGCGGGGCGGGGD